MLDKDNPLVQKYRLTSQLMANGEDDVKIRLIGRRDKDGRQHNLPTANEVAALINGDFDSMANERDIIVRKINGKLKKLANCMSYISRYNIHCCSRTPKMGIGPTYTTEVLPIKHQTLKKMSPCVNFLLTVFKTGQTFFQQF